MSQNNPKRRRLSPVNAVAGSRPVYPFTGIVGQEEMKLSLLLNLIEPRIGGVLIMGHRGTGKSTAVRALADLLPPLARVKGCPYGCDPHGAAEMCAACAARRSRTIEHAPAPVVDLPLGATEDRVCGTLDIERALRDGVRAFEPGLLARANRGFLYIDEVNLLDDHIVDLLLDVAASGRNAVEREGIGISHPARFVLVGSGNPEEGELRPQLLDRFGLHAGIATITDAGARIEIVLRRERFERDPEAFRAAMEPEQARLRRRIARARQLVAAVAMDRDALSLIGELCLRLNVDGHRGELAIMYAAKALAAFEGRRQAAAGDVIRVAPMALRHRLRKDAFGEIDAGARIERVLRALSPGNADSGTSPSPPDSGGPAGMPQSKNEGWRCSGPGGDRPQTARGEDLRFDAIDCKIQERLADVRHDGPGRAAGQPGRRRNSAAVTSWDRGQYVRAVAARPEVRRVALAATLAAAAPFQIGRRARSSSPAPAIRIEKQDLRFKEFRQKAGVLTVFAVDCSGSMALNRMGQAKGALIRLLQKAYVHRDKVALIGFRGDRADVLLPPSRSVELAKRALDDLPVGGGTPLAAGLRAVFEMAARYGETSRTLLVLLTDGRANVGGGNTGIREEIEHACSALRARSIASLVIDIRDRFAANGETERLAALLGGRHAYLHPGSDAVFSLVAEAAEGLRTHGA